VERARCLAVFYVMAPVGAAVGFAIGGSIGTSNWRIAFLVCSIPVLLLCIPVIFIKPPTKQHIDEEKAEKRQLSWWRVIVLLSQNSLFMYMLVGTTLVTFGAGGFAEWFATFLSRDLGYNATTATLMLGAVTIFGGIGGTAFGVIMGDKAKEWTENGYFLISAISLIFCTLSLTLLVTVNMAIGVLAFLLVSSQFTLWVYVGPMNAVTANCVSPKIRTRAFAIANIVNHALGDAISPAIVGAVSAAGSLRGALIMLPVAFFLAMIAFFIGWRRARPHKYDKFRVIQVNHPHHYHNQLQRTKQVLSHTIFVAQQETITEHEELDNVKVIRS